MKRCLIIDDSSVVRKVAHHILESLGYSTTEADSGADAVSLCRVLMPDIVLLDWYIPEENVLETIARLRAIESDRRPLILYITTEHDALDLARALAAGADDYMMKPFDRIMLEDKLQEIAATRAA
jgi:two-component system chemotaxis response regulator CheY